MCLAFILLQWYIVMSVNGYWCVIETRHVPKGLRDLSLFLYVLPFRNPNVTFFVCLGFRMF